MSELLATDPEMEAAAKSAVPLWLAVIDDYAPRPEKALRVLADDVERDLGELFPAFFIALYWAINEVRPGVGSVLFSWWSAYPVTRGWLDSGALASPEAALKEFGSAAWKPRKANTLPNLREMVTRRRKSKR